MILAGKKVGIAGAGGLGSNCAAALVRAGVGTLVIADFDSVAESNLDRQFYFADQVGRLKVEALRDNLERIDPGVRTEIHPVRLDPESAAAIFAACDVVVEAFDSAEAKAMLIETVLGRMTGMPIIAASGLSGYGRTDSMRVLRSGRVRVVGDLESEVSVEQPPVAPRVGIAANMEANEALEILLGEDAGWRRRG